MIGCSGIDSPVQGWLIISPPKSKDALIYKKARGTSFGFWSKTFSLLIGSISPVFVRLKAF
jgi:hypothetical protein